MKNLKYIMGLFLLLILFSSCEKVNYEFGDLISPTNVTLTAEIVGQDEANPYGDGSGTVIFTSTANNAISYKYVYDGNESIAPSGLKTFNFGLTGIHTYSVTVVAIGTGGLVSSATIEVEVFAAYNPPADLLTMLTGDDSRTWRIESEVIGHFGVGPVDAVDPIWWAAQPNDKAGLGAYDDRFVFNIDGTFTHITNGTVYGQAGPMTEDLGGDKGMTANSNGEFENYPLDDYSVTWALSAPGGQETLQLSGIGFHGFYVGGSHSYIILSRTANEMHLKTVGLDGNSWFVIFIAE
ncbi:MAG TPA: glucan endo-1,3-beta-D-glucosidase [Bacteroidales bacterium]|nr:glucan endo-1,3-beta-D-glucosidase [Bacteroidales bacterium]